MARLRDVVEGIKPAAVMVVVQVVVSGVSIMYKLADNANTSMPVLVAYRLLFATATLLPLAIIFETWKEMMSKVRMRVVWLGFFSGLFGGSLAQNLYSESLILTSPTFAAAISNLLPAVTFILAIIFRMERLGLRTWAGKAKIIGTCLCIGGAMLLTFYKGSQVKIWSTHFDLLHKSREQQHFQCQSNTVLGLLLALAFCFSLSFSLILQAKMGIMFPKHHYTNTTIISFMGSIQAIIYAICKERDWAQWRFGWNIKLFAAAYMGMAASGLVSAAMMYSIHARGPVFVSSFSPLILVLVGFFSSLFLNEKLYLGSFMGGIVIIIGLYFVISGKNKEAKHVDKTVHQVQISGHPTAEPPHIAHQDEIVEISDSR